MRTFSGFPSGKVRVVRLPEPFFTDLLPLIDDLDELKVTLYVFYRLSQQAGSTPHLRHRELVDDPSLVDSLGGTGGAVVEAALDRAVERGTLLRAEAEIDGRQEVVYFANTPRGRAALEALRRGEPLSEVTSPPRPNVFVLYEENIGPLTPLIAEELKEAEGTYPADWIEAAFREAVALNKRSWRYIRAILERWRTEGRKDETDRRGGEGDRRRYIEGKYGEYIEH
ncbi:MAG TPA: DnaD domain protein [Thermoflexia bacterium]|jgi:DnaD/phage-associated family protein|nr:DnaD domain protein [Thermoflexia bacterium]